MKLLCTSVLIFLTISLYSQDNSSLQVHYTFTGNADDSSGNENHGTVDGATLTTDRFGEANSAYEFDGEDDIITVLDNPAQRLEGDFTIVAWVLPYSQKDHTILRKNSSAHGISAYPAYGIGLSGTQHFVMNIGSDEGRQGISSQQSFFNQPYQVDTWYRIIARKQDTTIYITTNPFGKNSFTNYQGSMKGNIPYDSSPLIIGSRTQQQSNTFEGKIDDIKIYDRFMTLEEVTGLSFNDDDPEGEEDEEDPELEDEDPNESFSAETNILIDPWKFLLIESNNDIITNAKLSKDGELLIDQDNDSKVMSINLEGFMPGQYILTLASADDFFEAIVKVE